MSEEIDFSMVSEGTGMGLSATDLSPLEGGRCSFWTKI